jgi:hypothetical protein
MWLRGEREMRPFLANLAREWAAPVRALKEDGSDIGKWERPARKERAILHLR